jgi:hypothetical protein
MPEIPSVPSLSGGSEKSTFLLKKEKLVGIGTAILVLSGVALIANKFIIPFINELLGNLFVMFERIIAVSLITGAALIALAMLYWLIKQGPWLFAMWSRKMTMAFIKMDPIAVLKGYSEEYLEKKKKIFSSKVSLVGKQCDSLEQKIDENDQRLEDLQQTCDTLKNRSFDQRSNQWASPSDYKAFSLASIEFDQRTGSSKTLATLLERLTKLKEILNKFYEALDYQVESIRIFVDVKSTEYEAMRDSAAATESGLSVFRGDERKQIFDMAVGYVRDQIGAYMGQVETALRITEKFTSGHEVKQAVATDRMLAHLERMGQNADSLLDASKTMQQVVLTQDPNKVRELITGSQQRQSVTTDKTMPSRLAKYRLRNDNQQ